MSTPQQISRTFISVELITLVVIDADGIDSYKSNYGCQAITFMVAPNCNMELHRLQHANLNVSYHF